MTKTLKYVIDAVPQSNNKFMANSHNFHIYRKEKEKWHGIVKAAIKEKPKKPLERAVVHIKYYFKDRRRRDPDNYSGKMLLDPLVREGVLEDDSFKNVVLKLSADVDSKRPRTEITITEIGGEDGNF